MVVQTTKFQFMKGTQRELEQSIGFNLNRASQLYKRELLRVLSPYNLTPEQWQVLAALTSTKEMLTQAEISQLTFKDKHSISRMLDRMEQGLWVIRSSHPNDARAFTIKLGKRGGEILEIRRILSAHFGKIDSVLSTQEQRNLLLILRNLRSHLGDDVLISTPQR